jgi:ligand-binding sensor domain-containing protein/signal transduction histidine kinase
MRVIKAVLITVSILIVTCFVKGQNTERFERITRIDGLSHDNIHSVMQDNYGFMWFGTHDGLCRYDGFLFKYYYNEPSNLNSVLSSNISTICQGKKNVLWIGTYNKGFSSLDPAKNQFKHFVHDEENKNTLTNNNIKQIIEDNIGNLWIATSGDGLDYFDIITNEYIHYKYDNKTTKSISSNEVNTLAADKQGNLWVGTNTNLDYFDVKSKTFSHYVLGYESYDQTKQISVKSLLLDKNKMLWIGTSDGLFTFDPIKKVFNRFKNNFADPFSISDDEINTILEDSNGNIWIGTNKGLNKYLPDIKGFKTYFVDVLDLFSLSSNRIECLFEDRANILWIGTKGGGLNKLDLKRKKFYSIQFIPGTKSNMPNPSILSISGDTVGNIWVGTDGESASLFNRKLGEYVNYEKLTGNNRKLSDDQIISSCYGRRRMWLGTQTGGLNSVELVNGDFRVKKYRKASDSTGLSNNQVNCLLYDSEGLIWAGTQDGVNKLIDTARNKIDYFITFKKDYHNTNSISGNDISVLYQDHKGFIWIGTFSNGLNRLNPVTGKIVQFLHNPKDVKSLSSNSVTVIFEDHFGVMWVGTSGGGLNMLNNENDNFTRYVVKNGLASNEIMSIIEDHSGLLWISTSKGLTRFDPIAREMVNFDISDGLLNDGFNRAASYIDDLGWLYFGTNTGLVYFNPSEIIMNPHKPDVIITSLTIFKNDEWIDEGYFISKYSDLKDKIILPYDKNLFSLEFASMDFTNSSQNQYQYKIEGLNDNWVNNGNKRTIMVTNLEPGDYVIRVKASNNDGIYNDEDIRLPITISPPFWKTSSFIVVLIIIIGIIIVSVYSYLIKLNTNKILSTKNEELELANQMLIDSEKSLKELNDTKDKFFSIIAHDLRNPFNPLLALTELLDNDYHETEEKERIGMIKEIRHGAKKLYDLLENLLNWALSQTRQIKFNPVELDITDLIENNIELLGINAEKKDISISGNYNSDYNVVADENMLNSIIRNLMNNAIKFSPEHSKLEINLHEHGDYYKVEVKDQGPGIPPECVATIFSGFSQSSMKNAKGKGTGLGLILCKEFVEKNKGTIWLESELGIGSSFYFTIPKSSLK